MINWLRNARAAVVSPFANLRMIVPVSHADVSSGSEAVGQQKLFSLALLRGVIAIAGVVAAILAPSPANAAACQGQIASGTSITGRTVYDPFSPADAADNFQIGIRNTGGGTCGYALVFRSSAASPRLGATLTYSLDSAAAPSLITNAPANMAPAARTAQIAPAGSAQVEYQLVIPRGQFAGPGKYADTLTLELYALDDGGRISAPMLQSTTLAVSYTVAPVFSVNIKGSDATSTTTVHFGTLAKGQEARIEIQARSNQEYQLDVASGNRGVLALTPKVPGQNWPVPYTATLGGRVLNLASGASVAKQPPTRPESDASFPLVVTIGEVAGKRAGRYEDVITIEIRGARL